MEIKVVAVIQARVGSTRLPAKVLMEIDGKTILERVYNRVAQAETLDDVIVATTIKQNDDAIVDLCEMVNWHYYRGSEDDVLDRFYQCGAFYRADVIVRITADCPLIDPVLIDDVIAKFMSLYPDIDYASNTLPPRTYPRGVDVEVISRNALEVQWETAVKWREHVTASLRKNTENYRVIAVTNDTDYSHMRWCVDTAKDLEFVRKVFGHFKEQPFGWMDVIGLLEEHPDWVIVDAQEDPK